MFFCLFFCFCVFFGGFKGQVRWPEGPPHLALNPPYFFFFLCFFFFCFFCFVFFVFCWRVFWPEGPPHLALNPPYFWFCFFLVFCFLVFFHTKKNLVFPLEKGIFWLFSVFLFLSPLAFFDLPLFLFLFPCLSLFFFSFFIPSCLCFLLSFGSLFGSLSLFFFLLWSFFHERNNIKIFNCKFFLHQYFLFF